EERPDADLLMRRNEVTPKFFATLSIPLLAGRNFTDADRRGATKVAIVNERFVRKLNVGNNELIGKRFIVGGCGRRLSSGAPCRLSAGTASIEYLADGSVTLRMTAI